MASKIFSTQSFGKRILLEMRKKKCCLTPFSVDSKFRTAFIDPSEMTSSTVGKWYTIPEEIADSLHLSSNFPMFFRRQLDTLGTCEVMARRPLLDIVRCVESYGSGLPNLRFVLFGEFGTGKTMTLCQLLHYGRLHDFLLVHTRSIISWNRGFKEISMSSWKPGRIDLPLMALRWLEEFRHVNSHLLPTLQSLETSKDYEWGVRERTPAGSPLMDLVSTGINRVKFASDCIGALLNEIRFHATKGNVKVLVTVDEMNSLFGVTRIKREDGSFAPPNLVSLSHNLKKMLKKDWLNGVTVVVVDRREHFDFHEPSKFISPLPHQRLGKEGFELLEPFVPILVDKYSVREADSCLLYLTEMNWIQNSKAKTAEGRKELIYLSDRNPHDLERLCANL